MGEDLWRVLGGVKFSPMHIQTFYDFVFRAKHSLAGRSKAASHPHWHTYTVRLWFIGRPDQDELSEKIEGRFKFLHGRDLNFKFADSTDEGIALYFIRKCRDLECVRVTVTNDGRRGAEVRL